MTIYLLLGIVLAVGALNSVLLLMNYKKMDGFKKEIKDSRMETIEYMNQSFRTLGDMMAAGQHAAAKNQDLRLAELNEKFSHMSMENEQKLENIRNTMSQKITELNEENTRQLEKMRDTVDEKLQKTLEDRIGQSFKLVNDRLEQVYKGLGEMDAEQLWDTTMDPEKRILLKVTMDEEETSEIDVTFNTLMGDKVEPRREFIEANAKYVKNLDV